MPNFMLAICKRRIKVSSRLKGGLERAHQVDVLWLNLLPPVFKRLFVYYLFHFEQNRSVINDYANVYKESINESLTIITRYLVSNLREIKYFASRFRLSTLCKCQKAKVTTKINQIKVQRPVFIKQIISSREIQNLIICQYAYGGDSIEGACFCFSYFLHLVLSRHCGGGKFIKHFLVPILPRAETNDPC